MLPFRSNRPYSLRVVSWLFCWLWLSAQASAQHWTRVAPADGVAPPGRAHAAMIYDPIDHRIVVFGGRGEVGTLNDVWAFDLATSTWTDLSSGFRPSTRFTPAGIYDAVAHRMVIWSGQGDAFFNDVWAFDLETSTWTELMPSSEAQPNIRYGVAAVYDPVARDLVTFAGFTSQGRFDDTWRFDLENSTWTDISGASNPGRRCLHSAVYDASRHRMLIYGGQRSGPLGDVWELDMNANVWTEVVPATEVPAGRYFAATAYDAASDRLLVFGGNRGGGSLSNELWALGGSSSAWELIKPSGLSPSAREGASAVYVESEDRVVVVGGRSATYLSDVWSLDPASTGTAAESAASPGTRAELHPNYPNPFSSATTISYELPRETAADLAVYDLLGREIAVLTRSVQPAGSNSAVWNAAGIAAGTYIVQLRAGAVTRRRLVIRAE